MSDIVSPHPQVWEMTFDEDPLGRLTFAPGQDLSPIIDADNAVVHIVFLSYPHLVKMETPVWTTLGWFPVTSNFSSNGSDYRLRTLTGPASQVQDASFTLGVTQVPWTTWARGFAFLVENAKVDIGLDSFFIPPLAQRQGQFTRTVTSPDPLIQRTPETPYRRLSQLLMARSDNPSETWLDATWEAGFADYPSYSFTSPSDPYVHFRYHLIPHNEVHLTPEPDWTLLYKFSDQISPWEYMQSLCRYTAISGDL